MVRRAVPFLLLAAAVGCGGAGQSTTTAMSPMDPTTRGGANGVNGNPAEMVFKPAAGLNSPLGALKALAPKSVLAKAADEKPDKEGAAKLAKLGKEGLKLDAAYNYIVAGADAPRVAVGTSGAMVPLPADAKANPDGSIWVVDAESRRVFTLTGIKRETDKPATVAEAPSGDLVHPTSEAAVPPLALVARADEASTGVTHALRILAKGVGGEGAPVAGSRLRLKKSFSEKDVPLLARALVRTLKKYGAALEPGEGVPSLVTLADVRWTKEDDKAIAALHMSDFELLTSSAKPANLPKTGK